MPFSRAHRASGIFATKKLSPMLIGRERDRPFNNETFFFEPLLQGCRAFAYAGHDSTAIIGVDGAKLLPQFPEFSGLHEQIEGKCILDGEIVVLRSGIPDRKACGNRALLSCPSKIQKAMRASPAIFVASDIVYCDNGLIIDLPLLDRKDILEDRVKENNVIAFSRYLRGRGTALFDAVRHRNLEGIVAKHKNSRYHFGHKSPDWVAIRNSLEDDFIICGYTDGPKITKRLVLGQYDPTGYMLYKGVVSLSVSTNDFSMLKKLKTSAPPTFVQKPPGSFKNVTWLEPLLICSISFTARDENGTLYNPVYKGLRPDRAWDQAILYSDERCLAPSRGKGSDPAGSWN